jgi:hypothetical protein
MANQQCERSIAGIAEGRIFRVPGPLGDRM